MVGPFFANKHAQKSKKHDKRLYQRYNLSTMTYKVKVTTVGNSTGIVLPKELLTRLNIQKGDSLYVTETPDGVQLTPYDLKFVRVMDAAAQIMRENRDVLRKLAQ
jgi:putative addiction module antidote